MSHQLTTTAAPALPPVTFNFFDKEQFEVMQRVCKLFANSELVPDMYKVSEKNTLDKAMANCMIAIEMAQRIGASPLMIMQNMVIIYGRPSWSSKFLVATVNTCGRFNPLQYKIVNLGKVEEVEYTEYVWEKVGDKNKKVGKQRKFDGSAIDNLQCIAYTTAKGSDKVLESSPVTIAMAIQEGWYTKDGSKWKTMTRQMLMYRAASFWTSAYAPELSMGMKTTEEVQDIEDADYEVVSEKVKPSAQAPQEANQTEVGFDDPDPATDPTPDPSPAVELAKEPENPDF